MRALARATILCASLALSGCGAPAPPRSPLPPPIPAKPLHLAPLTDLVAAGGLEWLVVIRPAELLRSPVVRPAVLRVLPDERLGRLEATMGFDVRQADAALAAGFGPSTLFLIAVPHDGPRVTRLFGERLSSEVRRTDAGHRIVRVEGKLGVERRALVDLEESVVGLEAGPSLPLRAATAFAEEKLKRARPALAAPPLDALWTRLGDAPIVAVAPRSSLEAWRSGAHGVLARALSVGLSATPTERGLVLRCVVMGPWDDQAKEAADRLRLTVADLEKAPIGRLLGLDKPLSKEDVVTAERDAIALVREVDAGALAEGLWAATSAETRELFGPPRH